MRQEWIGSGWPQLLARLSLGALLVAAAASKWRRREEFGASLRPLGFGEGRRARWAAGLLPCVEMALGGLLLGGIATGPVAVGAALLMVLFALTLGRAARRGERAALRCAPGLNCRSEAWSVARNLGLAALALLPALLPPDALSADHRLRGLPAPALAPWEIVPTAGLLLFFLTGGVLARELVATMRQMRRAAGV